MADTAPVYASAFFSNPGAVYGLATAGQIPVGIAGGGMGAIAPLARTLVGYDADGAVGRFTSPVVSGTMSAHTFSAGAGGIGSTGDLTVTGAATALCTLTVESTATFSGGLSLAAGDLTLARNPIGNLHAATKAYVDSVASGLHVKAAVRARTTGALPEYGVTGSNTILTASADGALSSSIFDGVTIVGATVVEGVAVEGTRVLVANEPAGPPDDLRPNNGIYVVTSIGGDSSRWVLTRAEDADESAELRPGSFVFVTGGEGYRGDGFVLTTSDGADPTVGTTPLEFTQFSEAGTITPGGENGQFQFNNSGGFGGTSALTLVDGVVTAAGAIVVGTPTADGHAATKLYVDGEVADAVSGITLPAPGGGTGQVQYRSAEGGFAGSVGLVFDPAAGTLAVGTPTADGHAATKLYVDGEIADAVAAIPATAPAGGTGQVQYRTAEGAFGASSSLVFDPATGTLTVGTPSADGHAATRLYVDNEIADAVAAIPATAPAGSTGQVQFRTAGGGFGASAALTYDATTDAGVAVTGVPFTVAFEPEEGELGNTGSLVVGSTGVSISGIETTICAASGGAIADSPGVWVDATHAGIYGAGGSSGGATVVANNTGVSITGAYQISSGDNRPIQLKGDPAASGDLPGATGHVAVGAISGQDEGQEGAAVAFGTGAGVTAPRGIALGMGAVARVADAAVIPALSLSQNVAGATAGATAAVIRSGLAAYAAGMTFLPSAPLDLKMAGASSSFTVPTGAMFIPLGAVVWLHAINATGDIAVSPTLEVRRTSASGDVILPATVLAITEDSPVGLAVGATPSDFTAVPAGGVIFYRVAAAAAAAGLTSASARVALYGLCVELET